MLWCPITFGLLHPLSDDQKWSLPWDYQQINCTYSSQNVKHEWSPSCKPPLHLVSDFEYLLVADFSFCLSSRARQASHPCTSWVLQPSSPTMTFSGWAGNIGYPQVWCHQTSSNVIKPYKPEFPNYFMAINWCLPSRPTSSSSCICSWSLPFFRTARPIESPHAKRWDFR